MNGLELLRNPETSVENIMAILTASCPPGISSECSEKTCQVCWHNWLLADSEAPVQLTPEHHELPDDQEEQYVPEAFRQASTALYAAADNLLENLLYEVLHDSQLKANKERRNLLLYLMCLNRREEALMRSQHRAELMEIARLMETDYVDFRIATSSKKLITVTVFDAVQHRFVAELDFKKLGHSYGLDRCRFLPLPHSDSLEIPAEESHT